MRKKEIIENIYSQLEPDFRNFGFKWHKKTESFLSVRPDAIFNYTMNFYTRTVLKTGEKGFLVEPFIWITNNAIENIYKDITLLEPFEVEHDYISLGNSVANLKANPDGINRNRNQSLDLFVFEEKNINYVGWEIKKHFNELAIHYFLANSSVKAIDSILNKHPYEYCVHMNNDNFRFIKGLIAAKLNHNPNFSHLMEVYTKLIYDRDMSKICKEELSRFKAIEPMIGEPIL